MSWALLTHAEKMHRLIDLVRLNPSVLKKKTKAKPQTLEHLVYNSNRDQLYNRVIEERVRNSIIGYGNDLGV